MVFDVVKGAAESLIPPPPGEANGRGYRWRITVAVLLGATTLTLGTFIAGSIGLWPVFWAGFVQAQDLATFEQKVDHRETAIEKQNHDTQVLIVKGQLKQAMKDLCQMAKEGNNQFAIDAANNEVEGLSEQFYTLKGFQYQRPPCELVLAR